MKLIPKPDGFDLRDRRSTKSASCEQWEPRDALYDASTAMNGKEVDCAIVIWRERQKDGNATICSRRCGNADAVARVVMEEVGRYMGWKT